MLVKIILIVLGIYLLGKLIIRSVVSYFLGGTVRNMNDQMRKQQEEQFSNRRKKEGHVTINYKPKSNKNISKEEGDYIDFEEVK